jgi:exopolyphosphatase / guanosine-5'-triphosphate,3'-diphosphate pyrophosphatase
MDKVGIIDIGSNTVHLLVVEASNENEIRIIDDLSESVRLIDGFNNNNEITSDKIEELIQVLVTYKYICSILKTKIIIAVGTEALRKAKNNLFIIQKIFDCTGIIVKLLTGEEEASYDFSSVRKSVSEENGIMVDIGGGSTEIIWFKGNEIVESISLPIGCVSLSRKFNLQDLPLSVDCKMMSEYIFKYLNDVKWLKLINTDTLIGIGGSYRAIAKIDMRSNNEEVKEISNYLITKENIDKYYYLVKNMSCIDRIHIKGMPENRANLIVAALGLMTEINNYIGINNVVISNYGLRAGVLQEYLAKIKY